VLAVPAKSIFRRGKMEYRFECNECGEEGYITSDDEPQYCPICGSDLQIIAIMDDIEEELWDEDDQ